MVSRILFIFLMIGTKTVWMTGTNRCACVKTGEELVNECNNPLLNDCNSNATCSDLDNGFACTCNEGFVGDGKFCNGSCNGEPCIGANSTCFRNETCLCTPGFHELGDICVEECEVYSNTSYNDYPGTGLFCLDPIAFVIAQDLTDCKIMCNNATECISIGFDSSTSICAIWGCDPATTDVAFGIGTDTQTVSVKNCA